MTWRPSRQTAAVLGFVGLAAVLALTAPPGPTAEPIEAIVRTGGEDGAPARPSLLAATATTAALLYESAASVEIRFVDASNEVVASWPSRRRDAPRLVCTACPNPIVGDVHGYHAWSGERWHPTTIVDAPPSSLADPLVAGFGVVQETATGVSLPVLPGHDGTYLVVRDGGPRLRTQPTGVSPAMGPVIDLTGGPGQTSEPLSMVRDGPTGTLSVRSGALEVGGRATVVLADDDGARSAEVRGPEGSPVSSSAACRRLTAAAPLAVAVAVQEREGRGRDLPPLVTVAWLDHDLGEEGRVEVRGHYDHCAVAADGAVTLWTGTVAGTAAVDVAVVRRAGVELERSVTVADADDVLVSTRLRSHGDPTALEAWPLGHKTVVIDARMAVHEVDAIGGNQILYDDAGGTWTTFAAIDQIHRFAPEAAP